MSASSIGELSSQRSRAAAVVTASVAIADRLTLRHHHDWIEAFPVQRQTVA
ncbi:hypothetical protein [Cyanobium sp. CH-040]|uniref:hypothetical protein n=1 Tax=Cyanobium sp. CH-040 TaxID=2823708 RepID=UPI0020CBD164|nr:hypothetical protein [Cyanobium sp. CH-040]MCP9928798.1 hypothetical protein [Cyanobium sp. CH-040]